MWKALFFNGKVRIRNSSPWNISPPPGKFFSYAIGGRDRGVEVVLKIPSYKNLYLPSKLLSIFSIPFPMHHNLHIFYFFLISNISKNAYPLSFMQNRTIYIPSNILFKMIPPPSLLGNSVVSVYS